MKKILILALLLISSNIRSQSDQGNSNGSKVKIGATFFGDYFYKAGGDSTGTNIQYSPYRKEFNAFAIRRANIGVDYSINETFDSRFSISYDGPDTLSNGNDAVYVRDAFINWKEIFTYANLVVGIQPTPGYDYVSQKWWGYRSVEQTIMGMRNILGSRDLGIMLAGSFDRARDFGYYFMVGNGNGTKNENNKYKKVYGTLFGNFLDKKISADIYSDYQSSGNGMSRTTLSAFAGYKNDDITLGMENFFQIQNNFNRSPGAASTDIVPYGLSVYITGGIIPNELKFFVRYDFFNQDINNSSTGFYQSFTTAGFDFSPATNVHFMPNLWLNAFTPKTNQTVKYTTDVVPRITFWYLYN